MPYYYTHVFIAGIISFAAYVVAGYWQPLPFPQALTLLIGGLFYVGREAATSQMKDVKGWLYPLAASVLATAAVLFLT